MDFKLSHCLRELNLHGVQLAPEEFCDALWLTALGFVKGQSRIIPPTPQRQDLPQASPNPPTVHPNQAAELNQPPLSHFVHALGGSGERTMRGSLLSLPAAPAIANGIEFDRAFKPLRERHVIARAVELDEEATVTAIAETGIWQIIMRPARGRWLDIVVVVEQSPTMRIWQETAREFRQLLWRTCSPRSLRTFHIEWLSKRLRVHTSGGRQVSNQSPAQGHGRRLILVLSDAMSFGWLTADIPELIAQWARSQKTTLVQMLPEAMWRRTALRQVLPAPGKESSPAADASQDQWAQVTLTTLEPENLRRYARDLVGVTKESVASFRGSRAQFQVISPQTVEKKRPFDPQSLSPDEIEKIFRRFEAFSSPGAKRLARHLASAPLVLPVMRLVQRALVPDSAPSQLAEIFLSGIMFRQQTELGVQPQSNQLVYEFLPGIRERLIDLGGLDCLFATAELISEYVEKRLGKGGAFTALLEDPNAATKEWAIAPSSVTKSEPFAHVARVLLDYMGIAAPINRGASSSFKDLSSESIENHEKVVPEITGQSENVSVPKTSSQGTPPAESRHIDALTRPPRVYISRTSADLRNLGERVADILRWRGIEPVIQTGFYPSTRDVKGLLAEHIQQCDAVICLIGRACGSGPRDPITKEEQPINGLKDPRTKGRVFSYQQLDLLIARDLGRPVYTFFIEGDELPTAFAPEPQELVERQQAFITEFAKDGRNTYGVFSQWDQSADPSRGLKQAIEAIKFERTIITGKPCNLPHTSIGTLFKGRDEFLAELRQHLTAEGPVVIKGKRTIHGMGGVGKTRAAIEYAWKHVDDYRALLFISANTADALHGSLAALCGPLVLNLPEQNEKEQALQVEAALRWLKLNRDWLLIIDNVDTDEAAEEVRSLLGKLSTGHVLITSRIADWSGMVKCVELDILSESAAIAFLDERTEERRPKRADDREKAAKVVRMLDCLVLALERAGAHISSSAISYADYIRLAESHKAETLAWHNAEKMKYPRSLAITYETSIAQLSSGARDLFQILSWFAPDPIPRSLLDSRPTPAEERRHLGEIERLHLARYSSDGSNFIIHRLTQEITRQRQRDPNSTLTRALEWLYQAMPEDTGDVRTWPIAIPLVPHALVTATFGADRGIRMPCGNLFRSVAILYHAQANFSMAEPLIRRALTLHEAKYGASHSEVSCDLNHLAELLISTNRLAEAEPLLRRALVIDGAESGNSHPDVSRDLNNLAQLLLTTNRVAEAEPLLRQSLAIDEATYPASHPAIVSRLNNLASLLQSTNRLSEAEPLMRRALSIADHTLGENHPEVANVLTNYAQMLRATNRLDESEPLIRRALAIDETVLGDEHPKVARDLNDLAQVLHATNRFAEAEPLMRRALAIDEAALGEDHPEVAIRLNNLASLLKVTNRASEARFLVKRALETFEQFRRQTGYDHPRRGIVTTNYDELIQQTVDSGHLPSVFICYRREDTSAVAGRIYDWLSREFPGGTVLMDFDLEPGQNFRDAIMARLNRSSVVLVLIGPQWLTSSDVDGKRRLENAEDAIRFEVETALSRSDLRVIPLLVGNTRMPSVNDLPPGIAKLATLSAAHVRKDPDFHADMATLIRSLKQSLPRLGVANQPATAPGQHVDANTDDGEPTVSDSNAYQSQESLQRPTIDLRPSIYLIRKGTKIRDPLREKVIQISPPSAVAFLPSVFTRRSFVVPVGSLLSPIDFDGVPIRTRQRDSGEQVSFVPKFRICATEVSDGGRALVEAVWESYDDQIGAIQRKLDGIFRSHVGLLPDCESLGRIDHSANPESQSLRRRINYELGLVVDWVLSPESIIAEWLIRLVKSTPKAVRLAFNKELPSHSLNLLFTITIETVEFAKWHLVARRARSQLSPEQELSRIVERINEISAPAFRAVASGINSWNAELVRQLSAEGFSAVVSRRIQDEFGYRVKFNDFMMEPNPADVSAMNRVFEEAVARYEAHVSRHKELLDKRAKMLLELPSSEEPLVLLDSQIADAKAALEAERKKLESSATSEFGMLSDDRSNPSDALRQQFKAALLLEDSVDSATRFSSESS